MFSIVSSWRVNLTNPGCGFWKQKPLFNFQVLLYVSFTTIKLKEKTHNRHEDGREGAGYKAGWGRGGRLERMLSRGGHLGRVLTAENKSPKTETWHIRKSQRQAQKEEVREQGPGREGRSPELVGQLQARGPGRLLAWRCLGHVCSLPRWDSAPHAHPAPRIRIGGTCLAGPWQPWRFAHPLTLSWS